jgi:VWFA-related protein
MKTLHVPLLLAGALLLCRPPTHAQGVGSLQRPPVFRGAADVVRFDALVTDGRTPVAGLTAADFEVLDNGVAQRVDLATTADNVAVALALDLSGSVDNAHALKDLVIGCEALVDALHPADLAWLVTFSDQFTLKTGPVSTPETIHKALETVRARGGTSMWDAVFASVSLVTGTAGRSLVLVFSDGMDTTSWLQEKAAMETLQRSEVVVDIVMPRYPSTGFLAMEAAAKATGGSVMEADTRERLAKQFVKLLDDFRAGYILTYSPTGVARDDGWHDVKIRLKRGKGTVRARPGYFAGAGIRK